MLAKLVHETANCLLGFLKLRLEVLFDSRVSLNLFTRGAELALMRLDAALNVLGEVEELPPLLFLLFNLADLFQADFFPGQDGAPLVEKLDIFPKLDGIQLGPTKGRGPPSASLAASA